MSAIKNVDLYVAQKVVFWCRREFGGWYCFGEYGIESLRAVTTLRSGVCFELRGDARASSSQEIARDVDWLCFHCDFATTTTGSRMTIGEHI